MATVNSTRAKRPAQAAEHLGIGLSTFWRYAKTVPDFPKGIKVSTRITLYLTDELDALLAKWASDRRAK